MNNDIKSSVETMLSTAKHVFSNRANTLNGQIRIDPDHIYIYLLEKIEGLQEQLVALQDQICELKVKPKVSSKINK